MANLPITEPEAVTAGDTISWSRNLPDYPAAAGWILNYALRGPSIIDLVSDSSQVISISSSQSSPWQPGTYFVQGFVSRSDEQHTVFQGKIIIRPDLAAAGANYDGRSHAKRVLDAIEATIEGRASKIDLDTIIDGTRLSRIPHDQLLKLRNTYRNEYLAEQRREGVKNGKKSGKRILVRFNV